jgi:hypothetical protein
VKKWLLLVSVTVIGITLLAGKDDIQRFLRMKNM